MPSCGDDKLYLTAVFPVSFLFSAAPSKRKVGERMVSVSLPNTIPLFFFFFYFACPTNRPGSSWFMTYVSQCVCGDYLPATRGLALPAWALLSRRHHWQAEYECLPTSVHGKLRSQTYGPAVDIPAVYTTAPEFTSRLCWDVYHAFPQSLRALVRYITSNHATMMIFPYHKSPNSLSLDTIQPGGGVQKY